MRFLEKFQDSFQERKLEYNYSFRYSFKKNINHEILYEYGGFVLFAYEHVGSNLMFWSNGYEKGNFVYSIDLIHDMKIFLTELKEKKNNY